MGKKKKNSLVSAIKRIFSSKKETDRKKGIWGNGEARSFFPLFRAPSSIEKILEEADKLNIRPRLFLESPKTVEKQKYPTPPKYVSPRACSSSDPGHYPETYPPEDFAASSSNVTEGRDEISSMIKRTHPPSDPESFFPQCSSNGVTQAREELSCVKKRTCSLDRYPVPEPETSLASSSDCGAPVPLVTEESKKTASTAEEKKASAIKIEAAYRGYLVRRKRSGTSKGLVRLQGVLRGQNVRRQTLSAVKQMQLLVRVQTHIQSRRMRILENQETNHTDKDVESRSSRRTLSQILSESAGNGDWNDSFLAKEEEEAQLHKKAEAIMKRERAMAYAHSHRLWKLKQRLVWGTQDLLFDPYPWSWSWFNRQLPVPDAPQSQRTAGSVASTPVEAYSASESSTRFYNHRSSDSKRAAPFRPIARNAPWSKKLLVTMSSISRASPASSGCDTRSKDDESLVSCPAFTGPHYMRPTISASAKSRSKSNQESFLSSTPDSKRRFSLPFAPDSRNFKWNKGGFGSQAGSQYHESPRSNKSSAANSTVSMPTFVGRKPFKRFV